jgi:hypothetical protein
MSQKFKFFLVLSLAFLILLNGCGHNLRNYYDEINKSAIKKDYKAINAKIESSKDKFYGNKSELLYCLDKAYFLHLSGDYENSNKYFTQAKNLYDDFYTKSITKTATTFVVNDKIKPYYGEDFEISMLFVFKILNYLLIGQPEEAGVEARGATHYLKTLKNNNYSKKVYKEDAFLQYLTALVYEILGEYNDAYISYKDAIRTYNNRYFNCPVPQDLFNSMIDIGKKLGMTDEIEIFKKDYPMLYKNYVPKEKNKGELIIFHYDGLVPYRISTSLQIAFGKAWAGVDLIKSDSEESEDAEKATKLVNSIASDEQIVVSVPTYVPSPYLIDSSEILLNNATYNLEDVNPLGNVTSQNFDDKKAGIYAKSFARSAIKFTLVRSANKAIDDRVENPLLAFALKAGTRATASFTEDADKRTWRVLPDKVKMARIKLDKGNYSFDVKYKTKDGFMKQETINDIEIKPNSKKFVILHTTE